LDARIIVANWTSSTPGSSNHCYRPDGRDMADTAFIKILHLVV
jgi:hypothetical protein